MSDPRCGEFQELVSGFVDERLERPELLRLEGHLAECPPCRGFEADLRRLRELLQAGEALRPLRRPPAGFAAAVVARAARESSPRAVAFPAPRRRVLSRIGLVAAAAAAVLYVGWSWQRLVPGDPAAARVAARPAAAVTLAAAIPDEGDMDAWMSRHAMLARDATLLGSAEEVEFASFRAVDPGR